MIIKIIGGASIVICSIFFAISHRRFEERRLRTLDGLIALITYIKGQVDCYALPIGEILSRLPAEIFYDCNCPEGADSIDEIVAECRIYLEEESLRLVEAFASEFGSTFREEQLRRCDHYISSLGAERRVLAEDVIKRSRVGSALWVCSSLAILILLW